MAEYIERETLMKFPIRRDHCDKEHANEHFINGIETVMEYAENLPAADVEPVRRWISTDERQPEKRGRYLVVEQNWLNKLNVQEAKWNGEDWLTVEKKREITPRVIYWMPLPEPPEMDGGAENAAD